MGIIIGIDAGISATKIVGLHDGQLMSPLRTSAADQLTSLYGAFGKYLHDNQISLDNVEQVMLTGVGSAYADTPIWGRPTLKVDEFTADGLGARYVSGLPRAIVVSMGTGTSFVEYSDSEIRHIGGIGIGGGTLAGLARVMLKTDDIAQIAAMAAEGDTHQTNLLIKDISTHALPGLPMTATASLFSRAQSDTAPHDLAAGIVALVLQGIGSASVLAALRSDIKDFVLIGSLSQLPQCKEIFPLIEQIYGVRFHIPPQAAFCTAIGAALSHGQS